MKNNGFLLLGLGAIAIYALSKNANAAPQSPGGDVANSQAAIASPLGQQALNNIANANGSAYAAAVKDAVTTSTTTTEALAKVARINVVNNHLVYANSGQGAAMSDTASLVQQTSLKSGGGGKGLASGTYNISGLGSVTVRQGGSGPGGAPKYATHL